jgi:hypothetical protein
MARNNLQFTGIYVGFAQQASISWEDIRDKTRYHIWVHIPSLEPITSQRGKRAGQIVLMKNPPHGTVYRGAGHFDTRHLNGSLPQHKKMILETIAYIKANGLLEKALEKEAEKEARRLDEVTRERLDAFAETIRGISRTFLNKDQINFLEYYSNEDILKRFKRDMKNFTSGPQPLPLSELLDD